jgi:uncharacterized RDD family membrane protein YckC
MTSASDDNRFAPPLAHVEDVELAGPGTLAGRWTRLGATLIDALLAGLAFGLLAVISPINIFRPSLAATSGGIAVLLVQNLVIGFVLFLVIHGYLIATRGQTVGKALLKIRIVRSDGSPASFGRIVGLRYLTTSVLASVPVIGSIYALVDVLFIFRAARRCLHDYIADTIVVTA